VSTYHRRGSCLGTGTTARPKNPLRTPFPCQEEKPLSPTPPMAPPGESEPAWRSLRNTITSLHQGPGIQMHFRARGRTEHGALPEESKQKDQEVRPEKHAGGSHKGCPQVVGKDLDHGFSPGRPQGSYWFAACRGGETGLAPSVRRHIRTRSEDREPVSPSA